MSMTDAQTYTGGCHCGQVRFEVTTNLARVLDCNCSFCQKRGALWTYVGAPAFKLLSGADQQTEYRFNTRRIQHLFCSNCGVASFGRGTDAQGNEGVGINVRCLDGVDIASLTLTPFDGRSF